MQELHLSLLGSPQIFVDGEEKNLRQRKATALLAYLAVEQTPQGRDTLATLFWPEHDQKRARANLRYLLWSLRKVLGEEWLGTDGDQIVLADAGKIRVDVEEFRRYLDEWRAHPHEAGAYCAACVESLEAAEQCYRGGFLQGFTLDDSPQFDDWQFFWAEGLRRDLAAGLEALVEQQIVRQSYETAIDHARRWLALDPLHEPAHRALMKLYAWSGQYEAAIRQFQRCSLVLQEEIGVEPDVETAGLYAQIRNRRFPLPQKEAGEPVSPSQPTAGEATGVGNLRPIFTSFVGRQTELAQIAQRLGDPSARLLTIVGPGGIGKSTLAVQAGRAEETRFPDGVWFVSLAGMESAAQAPTAILAALDAPSGAGGSARQQLLIHLRRKHSLLILDNFEDVLPAAESIAELLHTCPQVKLIVTSRERLNLREEWLLTLGSLTYPAEQDAARLGDVDTAQYSALRLFTVCAQRVQPAFVLEQANLAPVIRICQLVDGMPLALEVAAAWVRVLPLADIPAEIEKSLAFLSTSARDVAERHRTIHAVFDHSWQILTEREHSVLRQLSVFRHGFTREGAEAVAGASLLDLSTLLDKSWIRLTSDGRYSMHPLAQRYALEKLQSGSSESAGDVLQRHCVFYAGLAPPEGPFSAVEAIVPAAEIENVKLAWETALTQRYWTALGQIAISIHAMVNSWGNLGTLSNFERTVAQLETELQSIPAADEEQRDAIEMATISVLHLTDDPQTRLGNHEQSIAHLSRGRSLFKRYRGSGRTANVAYAYITLSLGSVFYLDGQFAKAEALDREALTGFDNFGDTRGSTIARWCLALINDRLGRYRDAERVLRLMISTQEKMGRRDPMFLGALGRIYVHQGRYGKAQPLLKEAYAQSEHRYQSHVLINWGAAARGVGNAVEARELLLRGLAIADETGDRPAQTDLLAELGFTEIQLGEAALAQDHFSRSLAVAEEIGRRRTIPLALLGLGKAALQQGRLKIARDHLAQALTAAAAMNAPPDLLDVLVGVGELYAAEGKRAAAIELLDLARQHPATNHEIRTQSLRLLQTWGAEHAASESDLPVDAAHARLEEVTRNTLADLQS